MALSLAAADLIGSGLSFGGGIISNLINRSTTRDVNNQNVALTREINQQNIDFTRDENAITRAREDNAVQRAAADMQRAGLSKTLAAGSPASAASLSTPTLNTPQVQGSKWESALQKADLANVIMQIYNSEAEIDYKKALIDKANAETSAQLISNGFAFENHKMDMNLKESQVENYKAQSRANNAKSYLDEIYGSKYSDEIEARIAKLASETKYVNMNTAKAKQEIRNLVREEYGISKKNDYLVEQIAESKLNQARIRHDLGLAKAGNYEFGQPTKLFGFPLGNAISNFNTYNGAQKVFIPGSNFIWLD